MENLRFGNLCDIIRKKSGVKFKADFLRFFISRLLEGFNSTLAVELSDSACSRIYNGNNDYRGAAAIGGTVGIPFELYDSFSRNDDIICCRNVKKVLKEIQISSFERESQKCLVNIDYEAIRKELKYLNIKNLNEERMIDLSREEDTESYIAKILVFTIKYIPNISEYRNLIVSNSKKIPKGLAEAMINIFYFIDENMVLMPHENLYTHDTVRLFLLNEPVESLNNKKWSFVNNLDPFLLITKKNAELIFNKEKREKTMSPVGSSKALVIDDILDEEFIQRGFIVDGRTINKEQMDFIRSNFYNSKNNIVFFYGFFEETDILLDSIKNCLTSYNKTYSIDIAIEFSHLDYDKKTLIENEIKLMCTSYAEMDDEKVLIKTSQLDALNLENKKFIIAWILIELNT